MDNVPDPVILAFADDITERREIERALARKEHEFQTLVRNLPDFISRATPDSTLTYVNDNYARFVGLPADKMIGRKFLDFVPEEHRPELIFLDIVLPGMNGFAALRAIRRDPMLRDIPVIMMSGNEQAMEKFFGTRIGADDFMKKPF